MSDTLQDELRALFARAKMPSSPALAVRILELAEDPDSTIDEFADLIRMDPALSARLLGMANSAAYAQCSEVTTIHRAVSLMGINRVRTLSLGFQLVAHLDRLGGCAFDMKQFWRQSLLRACLARVFAERLAPSCVDEAFLIGLLQDCGVILLVQLLGEEYAELCRCGFLSPTAFLQAEKERFRHNHVETIGAAAREWKLPGPIVEYVEGHHNEVKLSETANDGDRLAAINYLIGSLPLAAGRNPDDSEPALAEYAKAELGLDDERLLDCLNGASGEYAEMSRLHEGTVPEDLDVTDLLGQANAHLTRSVETERDRSDQEQARLRNALGEYRELAARDPLTGILNRGALTDATRYSVKEARREGQPIAVMFLDIDNFKQLNDRFGHQTGDEILKGVAATLRGCTPNAGVLGRYGGEEFVLAVTNLIERDAHATAERVLAGIRGTPFSELGVTAPVTCSLGAVHGIPESDATAEDLLGAADELMYRAKRAGKDRCCFRRMGDVYNVDLLESDLAAIEACTTALFDHGAQPRCKKVLPEEFARISKILNRRATKGLLDMRKHDRKELMTPCRITVLTGTTVECDSEEAYVRNISTGGIGLLTARSVVRGQPAEIVIRTGSAQSKLFVAGVVAFCRHIEEAIHEVGIQVFMHAKRPILSHDPVAALRNLEWAASALKLVQRRDPAIV